MGNFFVGDGVEKEAEKSYKFYMESLLYAIRILDYNISIIDLLNLPYCMYNDLIMKNVQIKKKEKISKSNKPR